MNPQVKRLAPWIAGALALVGAGLTLLPQRPVRGFDLDAFGRLPVLDGGRVKPIDSVARNSLMVIRGAQSFQHAGRTVGPEEWLLDTMFRPALADAQPIFQIDDPDVLGLIGLPQTSQRRFAFTALAPYLQVIEQQATAAERIDAKQRTRFQGAVVNLAQRVFLYFRLKNTLQLERSPGLVMELGSRGRARRPAAPRGPHPARALPADPPEGGRAAGGVAVRRGGARAAPRWASASPSSRAGPASASPGSRRTRRASTAPCPSSGRARTRRSPGSTPSGRSSAR